MRKRSIRERFRERLDDESLYLAVAVTSKDIEKNGIARTLVPYLSRRNCGMKYKSDNGQNMIELELLDGQIADLVNREAELESELEVDEGEKDKNESIRNQEYKG